MENFKELGKLLFNISRLHGTRADQLMDQIGLFRGQGMLLKYVARHDGLTHSEIAENLQISPAAVTKVIKRLEELDFLKRQPDPKDERVSRVFIQPEGCKVIEQIHEIFLQLDSSTFQGFSEEELDQLNSYLRRMEANLQNSAPELANGGLRFHKPGFHRPF
jgi:MarR family transcriptional regulator, organic hydroperoxide resistance regulator